MGLTLKIKSIILSFFLILVTTVACATEVSLRDKIGQMIILGFQGKVVDEKSPIVQAIEKDNIGGVILFDFNQQSQTFDKNIESPEQVNQLNNQLQILTQKANHKYHRDNLPLLVSVDYEGGMLIDYTHGMDSPKCLRQKTSVPCLWRELMHQQN